MLVPNNYSMGFLLNLSFWGVLGVPPFKKTPIYSLFLLLRDKIPPSLYFHEIFPNEFNVL